jgi:hypothetical protein
MFIDSIVTSGVLKLTVKAVSSTLLCFYLCSQGAPAELSVRGNVTAKFSPASNKLLSVALSFDTGAILSQINHVFKYAAYTDVDEADTAAHLAASKADAILDSLQMPHIATSGVPKASVVPVVSAASITDGEKSDSSDESHGYV